MFDRPVFVVPGPITSSLSKGTNSLLKDGLVAVTSSADMLDKLDIMGNQQKHQEKVLLTNPEEQQILELLRNGTLHFDEIVRTIEKDSKAVGSLLSLVELSSLIHQDSGKYFL